MREENLLNSSTMDRNSGLSTGLKNLERANFSGSLYPKVQNSKAKIRMKNSKVDFKTLINSQSFNYAMSKLNERLN